MYVTAEIMGVPVVFDLELYKGEVYLTNDELDVSIIIDPELLEENHGIEQAIYIADEQLKSQHRAYLKRSPDELSRAGRRIRAKLEQTFGNVFIDNRYQIKPKVVSVV